MVLPLATDDVGVAAMLPFVAPALLLLAGVAVLALRDRVRRRD
jgi:hypothetical protein